MRRVSFQVVAGVDKGRCFLDLTTPITIGREEGNTIRLNDDRVSRFHAKIQEDHGQLVLTDLDSTNGTQVNGETVQLRILRISDFIHLGRSTIVYGTVDEIAKQSREEAQNGSGLGPTQGGHEDSLIDVNTNIEVGDAFDFGVEGPVDVFEQSTPPLPSRLTPAQAAQLSELIDYLHRGLADAVKDVRIPQESPDALLPRPGWQRVQALLAILAQYSRMVAEPGSPDGG